MLFPVEVWRRDRVCDPHGGGVALLIQHGVHDGQAPTTALHLMEAPCREKSHHHHILPRHIYLDSLQTTPRKFNPTVQ